ncbi:hypothetical protein [Bradyrhizobium sp.]|jgi:hypothetical protein|uniref:hypothetical protein n=1 Tax=Bradyrhizobium sp. TaxID=376 RepID=UPI002E09CB95|nr:hypothetical protein [Bradyrhizobium sp.]
MLPSIMAEIRYYIAAGGQAPFADWFADFGRDGDAVVVLLIGGTKKRQQRDIEAAHSYWQDYRQGKRGRR